jgi:hypothetical protein
VWTPWWSGTSCCARPSPATERRSCTRTVHSGSTRSTCAPCLDAVRAAELDRLARERHALALDHRTGPLIAGLLVRTADDDAYLLLTVDHAVCDGWSIGVILAELTAYYNGVVSGRGARLWPVPLQYGQFAAGQRRTAAQGGYDEQLAYWAERLAPDPPPLGLAYARSPVDGYRSGQHPVVVPAEVAGAGRCS